MAASLQRNLAGVEAEKRDTERAAQRLLKDKSALKKSLNKVPAVQHLLFVSLKKIIIKKNKNFKKKNKRL